MYERILSPGRFKMDRRQNSLLLMLYAYLAAIAAGVNFYWTRAAGAGELEPASK